ncbi:hypothetical protein K3495_g12420 [Podosphaera aphanis]|nr:hypothetical protein K3495_g12420 [Podosphaera aphanis]
MALRAALSIRRSGEKIYVLLDNQAAVRALQTGRTSSCLRLTRIFHDVSQKANSEVRWVPGHSKIPGNEEADAAARAAPQSLPPCHIEPKFITLAYVRRLMQQRRQQLIDDWWSRAKGAIETRFGNAIVERRESWTILIIGPIKKKVRCHDGQSDILCDPLEGLLQEELATVRELDLIRYMNWTLRSKQSEKPDGYIRIYVPECTASRFPSILRVFGASVSVQRFVSFTD